MKKSIEKLKIEAIERASKKKQKEEHKENIKKILSIENEYINETFADYFYNKGFNIEDTEGNILAEFEDLTFTIKEFKFEDINKLSPFFITLKEGDSKPIDYKIKVMEDNNNMAYVYSDFIMNSFGDVLNHLFNSEQE